MSNETRIMGKPGKRIKRKRGRPRKEETGAPPSHHTSVHLEDLTHKRLRRYSECVYGKVEGKQSTTIQHILRNVLDILFDPHIQEMLVEREMVFRKDPMLLLRMAVSDFMDGDTFVVSESSKNKTLL